MFRTLALSVVLGAALVSSGIAVVTPGTGAGTSSGRIRRQVRGRRSTGVVGQLKEAHSQIKKLKRQAKGDVQKALAEEAFASYYLARRQLPDAEKRASAAVDMHPAFSVGFRTRALVRMERGNLSGAEEDFRSALSFDGSDTGASGAGGRLLAGATASAPLIKRYLDVDSPRLGPGHLGQTDGCRAGLPDLPAGLPALREEHRHHKSGAGGDPRSGARNGRDEGSARRIAARVGLAGRNRLAQARG
jgi:hypothetical protein